MNDRDFSDAMVWIVNSSILSIDTETTGLHPHEWDEVLGIGVANENKQAYFPLRHPGSENLSYGQVRNLIAALSEPRKHILFHNAIFDWPFLRKEGWTYPEPWRDTWDTMVVRWLTDENAPKSLEECVSSAFGLDGTRSANAQKERQKRIKKIGWANTTYDDIQTYGCFDVRHTFDLYLHQRHELEQDPELEVARVREHKFLQVCDEMIGYGLRIDAEQATTKLAECDRGIERIETEYPGINFDSPKQLGDLLYSDDGWSIVPDTFTATGQPSTDKDTLLRFVAYEPRIQDIFDYRKLRKARSTYYVPMVERVGRDGRVHVWWRPHGTKTGRMSASDFNAQTLPHDTTLPGVKDCFIEDEGYDLVEYDLSQAELRVAAYYADDEVLAEHLSTGDVHSATATAMFGDAEGMHRHAGKVVNFSSMYGIGAKKLALTAKRGGLDIDEHQARQYLGMWRTLYHGVTVAAKEAQRIAEDRGYVNLWPVGRRRRFDTHHARFENPKDALSSVVQGGVGEYVKQLMMDLREPALRNGIKIVGNVHDSLLVSIPKERGLEERWTRYLQQEAALINPFKPMKMPIGRKIWGTRSD